MIPKVAIWVSTTLGKLLSWPVETMQNVAEGVQTVSKVVAAVIIASMLLTPGVAAVASSVAFVAIVGIVLIVAAVGLLAYAAWNIFGPKDEDLPPGQKPDNVSLGGLF